MVNLSVEVKGKHYIIFGGNIILYSVEVKGKHYIIFVKGKHYIIFVTLWTKLAPVSCFYNLNSILNKNTKIAFLKLHF